jgi:DNA-binding MarR family transcriptional regulator
MTRLSLDPYVVDVLLPDLVGHDRRPSAFLVYLHLLCAAARLRRDEVPISLQTLAVRTGLSKSSVQAALRHLGRRGLVDASEPATSTRVIRKVRRPWAK